MDENDFTPDDISQLRDIALQQRIDQAGRDKDTYLSTGGVTAHDTIANFDKGQKSVDEFASKMFGGDTMRMARYRNAVAVRRATTRKHLQSLADTEARQSAIASQKRSNEADLSVKLDNHVLEMSTVTCAQDQAMSEQSEIFNSALATADGNLEEVIRQIQNNKSLDDETKKKQIAEAKAAGIYMKTKASLDNQGIVSKIDNRSALAAIGQVDDLSGWIRESFAKELAFQKSLGRTDAVAIDVAMESTRNLANKYFTGRIARGQAEEVLIMLNEIEQRNDMDFAEKKTFDPSRMMFCRHEDFKSLKDAGVLALQTALKRSQASTSAKLAAQRAADDNLSRKADDLEYTMAKFFDKMIATDGDPMSAVEKFIPAIDAMDAAGYKDAAGLYSKLQGFADRVIEQRKKIDEHTSKMTAAEKFDSFTREFDMAEASTADEVFMRFAAPGGKIVQSNGVERRSMMMGLINSILKDPDVKSEEKAYYRKRYAELHDEKMENDAAALEMMAKAVGFSYPTTQEESRFSYRRSSYVTVDDAPSRQEGTDVLFNPKNLNLLIASDEKVTWTDPSDPSVSFKLGKNEAQEVFRRMFSVIAETGADERANPKAMQSLAKRFTQEISVVARNADRDARMSRLSSAFSSMERSLFKKQPRVSYMIHNARTRQQTADWMASRKQAATVIKK